MKSRASPSIYLGISFALHAAVIFIGWLTLPILPQLRTTRVSSPMQIEIAKDRPNELRHGMKESRYSHSKAPQKGQLHPALRLKDLGIFSNGSLATQTSNPNRPQAVHGSDLSAPSGPYAFENQIPSRSSPVLSYLFQRINGGLAYPSELRAAAISGEVKAVLRFDENGRWIESLSSLQPGTLYSRYLRIYVLHRLRALLSDPIPENIWKVAPQALSIEANFTFSIVAPEAVTGAQKGPLFGSNVNPSKFNETDTDSNQSVERELLVGKQGQYGKKFFFHRIHLSSKLEWQAGPFAGYGLMPAVGVNPGWFAEQYDHWIRHKAKIDPLERYREDPDW